MSSKADNVNMKTTLLLSKHLSIFLIIFIFNVNCTLCASSFEYGGYQASYGTTTIKTIRPGTKLRPEVIIFDLDKTIWPFRVDDVIPPVTKKHNKAVLDDAGNHLKLYPQIYGLFQELHSRGHKLAVIQVTPAENLTSEILHLLGLNKFITYQEIYVAPKWDHIESIHKRSGIDMGEFLYLSNEYDGISDIAELHTVPLLIEGENGVTMEDINKGYHIFSTEPPPPGGW